MRTRQGTVLDAAGQVQEITSNYLKENVLKLFLFCFLCRRENDNL